MKTKHFINNANHTLYTLMMALLFLWCGSMSVSAEGTGTKTDPYIWTDQTEGFATADGAQVAATGYRLFAVFTPQTDGILVISSLYSQFTDNTFSTRSETQPVWDGKYPQQAKLQCTAGNTYYVGNGSMSSSTVTVKYLAEAEPLKLTACSPEDGGVFNVVKGTVDLEFNQKVSVSGCLVTFGNQTHNPELFVTNAYVSANAKAMLMAAYNNGSLHEGDDIKFTFSGIKSLEDNSLLNGTGTFEVAYKAPAKPMSLVSSVNTPSAAVPVNDFKSYYMKDDATGTVTVTFSEAIGSVDGVALTFGNIDGTGEEGEASQYYREEVSYSIIDNNIVIDLKGKLRRFADMLPGVDISTVAPAFQDRFKTINLLITGVKDANGNMAYSEGQGTLGSYGFVYNFKEIEYTVAGDWAVVDGNAITSDTKNVELWMQETGSNATFTGVKFAYKEDGADKTAVVPFNEIIVADDTETAGAKIYTIPVPNVKMDEGTVTVSLDGVEAPDGVEHADYSAELTCNGRTAAVASEFAVTSAVWHGAAGDVDMKNAAIETFTTKSTSTIVLNKEVGYVTWELTEINGETSNLLKNSYVAESAITKANGTSTFDITWRGAAVTLKAGNTYVFTVKAWNNATEAQGQGLNNPTVGTTSFNITPAGVAYVYSDVVLQSHIADPYLLMNSEETTYTLEFSGPATVKKVVLNQGMGMSSECEFNAVEGTEDRTWIVTIPASALSESQILINVFAEDKEHRAINKALDYTCPTDGGDNVWLPIVLEAEFNKPAFTVEPANESVVDKIDIITFSYSKPINPSYAISDKIKIMTDGGRTLLYELGFDDVKRPEGYEGTDKLCIVLDEPITTPGNYTINVPSGFFNLGEEFEGASSRAATIYYEIAAPHEGLAITANPAAGTVTEIPATIVISADCDEAGYENYELVPTLVDDKNNSYPLSVELDPVAWNAVDIVLKNGAITAAGTYTLTIPAGAITDGAGKSNDELVVVYTISGGSDTPELTITPESESTVESLDKIVFTCEQGIKTSGSEDKITVYNKTTRTEIASFTTADVEFNDAANVWIEFAEPVTKSGIYEVTVPAGFFALGESGDANETMVIYYEIAESQPQEGFDLTVDPAGGNVTEIPATIVLTAVNRLMAANSYEILPTLKDEKGKEYALTTEYGVGMNQINIVLADGAIMAEGTYTLTIPTGSIIGNDETDVNKEVVAVYVISTGTGIDNIVANAGGKVDVYTVNGANVLRNADAAAVKALAKGLYIINGKKVVIK